MSWIHWASLNFIHLGLFRDRGFDPRREGSRTSLTAFQDSRIPRIDNVEALLDVMDSSEGFQESMM